MKFTALVSSLIQKITDTAAFYLSPERFEAQMRVTILNQTVLPVDVLYSDMQVAVDLHAQTSHAQLVERDASSIALQKTFDVAIAKVEAYSDRIENLVLAFDRFPGDTAGLQTNAVPSTPELHKNLLVEQNQSLEHYEPIKAFSFRARRSIAKAIFWNNDVSAHLAAAIQREIEE